MIFYKVGAKHRETKQFYTAYNTLEDTKTYLQKELSLLNSIHDNYAEYVLTLYLYYIYFIANLFTYFSPPITFSGMANSQTKEQFIKQLAAIMEGVKQTKVKVGNKCNDEKAKRDALNQMLKCLNEQQRQYAVALKKFTTDCRRNEELQMRVQEKQSFLVNARSEVRS